MRASFPQLGLEHKTSREFNPSPVGFELQARQEVRLGELGKENRAEIPMRPVAPLWSRSPQMSRCPIEKAKHPPQTHL
jgi:hypothetical protein